MRKVKFDEEPDYNFCQGLFDKALKRIGATDDGVYDWMLLNDGKGWEVIVLSMGYSIYLTAAHVSHVSERRVR